MDILGKQGKQAEEEVTQLRQEVGQLESHLDAVDNAFQDFQTDVQRILNEELQFQEDEVMEIKKALRQQDDIDDLGDRVFSIESRLDDLESNVKDFLESDIHKSLKDMTQSVKSTRSFMHNLEDRLDSLENRIDKIEGEMVMELNNRDFDFEKKLDKRKHEEDTERLEDEIKKLRASINILADQIDEKDKIEVE